MQTQASATTTFRFWIGTHAVKRFRERVRWPEASHLTDRDLALYLDGMLFAAHTQNRVTDILDHQNKDEPAKVAIIEVASKPYHVFLKVVKPSDFPKIPMVSGPNGIALGALTIYTQEMAAEKYAKSHWRIPGPLKHRPLASLAEKVTIPNTISARESMSRDATGGGTKEPMKITVKDVKSTRPKGGRAKKEVTLARKAFVMGLLREHPEATGREIQTAIVAHDGLRMHESLVAECRRAVKFGRSVPTATPTPAPQPVVPPPTIPTATRVASGAKYVGTTLVDEGDLPMQLSKALQAEALCAEGLKKAKARVDELMSELQSRRAR